MKHSMRSRFEIVMPPVESYYNDPDKDFVLQMKDKASKLTHSQLVELAAQWLARRRCVVVATEVVTYAGEIPDAIGWHPSGASMVVECKTSRANFKAERLKPPRRMGNYRYFLTPKGLLKPEELPDGWGLLEIGAGKRIVRVVSAALCAKDKKNGLELALLISVLRRVGGFVPTGEGISIRAFVHQTARTATVSVDAV